MIIVAPPCVELLLLMIEFCRILYTTIYQNPRNYGSVVCMCVYISIHMGDAEFLLSTVAFNPQLAVSTSGDHTAKVSRAARNFPIAVCSVHTFFFVFLLLYLVVPMMFITILLAAVLLVACLFVLVCLLALQFLCFSSPSCDQLVYHRSVLLAMIFRAVGVLFFFFSFFSPCYCYYSCSPCCFYSCCSYHS